MRLEKFRATCLSLFGEGWQSRLARELNVNPRTVRRWASGDIPVPPTVEAYLSGPAIAHDYPDEWLIAADPDEEREYLIHLACPRFVGRVLDQDDMVAGTALILRDEQIGEITWIDPPPADMTQILAGAQRAMDLYS